MYCEEVFSTSKVMSPKDWDMLAALLCGVINVMMCVSIHHYMFSGTVTLTVPPSVTTTYSGK